jgi:hypothetical protein
MAETKLFLDQSEKLDFNIKIESDANNLNRDSLKVWFTINESGFKYSLEAVKDESDYVVYLPKMKGLLSKGNKRCMIEVFCDGRYFVPWAEEISFEESMKVEASIGKRNLKKEDIKVSMKNRIVETKPSVPKPKGRLRKKTSGLNIKTKKGTLSIN